MPSGFYWRPGGGLFQDGLPRPSPSPDPSRLTRLTPTDRKWVLVFFHAVINARLHGKPLPGIPKKVRAKLAPSVERAGGPVAWVERQPDFPAAWRKAKAKRDRRRAMQIPSQDRSSEEAAPPQA